MKQITLLLLIFFLSCSCFGKDKRDRIDGLYLSTDSTLVITIKSDTLKMFFTNPTNWSIPKEIAAVCSYKKINNSFYEVNSIEGSQLSAFNEVIVEKVPQTEEREKNEITIITPNTTRRIQYTVFINSSSHFGKSDNKVCRIPFIPPYGDVTFLYDRPIEVKISMYPFNIEPSCSTNQFFGAAAYDYELLVKTNPNEDIIITLPSITNEVLRQFLLRHEYIYMPQDTIKWGPFEFFRIN